MRASVARFHRKVGASGMKKDRQPFIARSAAHGHALARRGVETGRRIEVQAFESVFAARRAHELGCARPARIDRRERHVALRIARLQLGVMLDDLLHRRVRLSERKTVIERMAHDHVDFCRVHVVDQVPRLWIHHPVFQTLSESLEVNRALAARGEIGCERAEPALRQMSFGE